MSTAGLSSGLVFSNTNDFRTAGLPSPAVAWISFPLNLRVAGFPFADNRFVILYLSLLTIDTLYVVSLSSICDKSKIPSLLFIFWGYSSSSSKVSTNLNSISSVIFLLVFESNISNW